MTYLEGSSGGVGTPGKNPGTRRVRRRQNEGLPAIPGGMDNTFCQRGNRPPHPEDDLHLFKKPFNSNDSGTHTA